MRFLLCLALLGAAAAQLPNPAAGSRTFLYQLQMGVKAWVEEGSVFKPNGMGFSSAMSTGASFVKTDICRIKHPVAKAHESAILGIACKAAFVGLYEEKPRCGAFLCDLIETMEGEKPLEFFEAFLAATTDDDAFGVIKEHIFNPVMEWNCDCTLDVLDTFMGCKSNMGEAKILSVNMAGLAGIDTNAPFQEGKGFNEFWSEFIDTTIPWDSIRTVVDRFVQNVCNNDNRGDKCYSYFYDTVTKMYQWYMKSTGLKPAGRSSASRKYDSSCTTFNMQVMATGGFTDIKEALVNKMCVDECSGLYQDTLFGCCTANMIQDNELTGGLQRLAQELKDMVVDTFGYSEEEANEMFSLYMGYATEALGMLRNPTCDNGVKMSPCAGLKGKKKKKCEAAEKSGEEGGSPCDGLKGKKKKKCMAAQEGDSGENPCAGLKGKKKKKCMAANPEMA
eukprot:sb/3464658/